MRERIWERSQCPPALKVSFRSPRRLLTLAATFSMVARVSPTTIATHYATSIRCLSTATTHRVIRPESLLNLLPSDHFARVPSNMTRIWNDCWRSLILFPFLNRSPDRRLTSKESKRQVRRQLLSRGSTLKFGSSRILTFSPLGIKLWLLLSRCTQILES